MVRLQVPDLSREYHVGLDGGQVLEPLGAVDGDAPDVDGERSGGGGQDEAEAVGTQILGKRRVLK